MKEQFIFFWHGIFSQWHESDFVIEGLEYNTAEQYMMASKARVMGDDETLSKILKEENPRNQKKLGREISNFDSDKWNAVARDHVFVGNYAKFSQNLKLRNALLETQGTTLVEASPFDKIWGIGMKADDPRALIRQSWQGTNWLGEVLTNVRNYIYYEDILIQRELVL